MEVHPHRGGQGAGRAVGGRAARAAARRAGLPVVRHRRVRSRLRAGDRHAGGRRADVVRGARARCAGWPGIDLVGADVVEVCAAVRRPRADHVAARGEPDVRARQPVRARPRSGAPPPPANDPAAPRRARPARHSRSPRRRPRAADVATITLDGVISPVTVRLVETALDRAQADGRRGARHPARHARRPRALDARDLSSGCSMRRVPVIVYVAPTGARAASAGVFITMAAHVAAMAPATNIGAAHPVAVSAAAATRRVMKKIENDAAAFARTIATERGRNADWAEKAVRESVSITEREAVRAEGRRPHRRVDARSARQDRRPDGEDAEGAGDAGHPRRDGGADRDRLPRPLPQRHHRSQRRLHPHDARHARALLRAVEPRRDPARRHRRHLAHPGVLRVPEPADQLRRPAADPLRHRAAHRRDQGREPRRARHRRHRLDGARLADALRRDRRSASASRGG